MSRDQTIGSLIFIISIALAGAYVFALFWPAFEAIRPWIIATPVLIVFVTTLGIGAWIGWTMATTPPQQIEEAQPE